MRIEDLDRPRALPGMADRHLRTLERHGLEWDGAVRVQSEHLDVYGAAFEQLKRAGCLYPCTCSRAELIALRPPLSPDDDEELHYPGRCRDGALHPERPPGWRFRVSDRPVAFIDRWQGPREERVSETTGDFIVKRRDHIIAYQLAVVVDDGLQEITDVVRGADLLSSTVKQRLLQDALGLPAPSYAHAPLVVGADGLKLAKSRHAVGVEDDAPAARLVTVLELLRQRPPRELARAPVAEVGSWALAHWDPSALKNMLSTRLPE